MDIMKTEYEFLDLSDVKEADRSSLQSALFKQTEEPKATFKIAAAESVVDLSSSSGSAGAGPAVSVPRSVESAGSGSGSGDMAPHSPARAPAAPPHAPYAAPPPAYPPPHHQWPVAPPNVYVSQVTANVNVHGYMGQYYQPQPQYGPPPPAPPPDRAGRAHRRDRRNKRAPSPPQHAPYYLHQYHPQYYPAAQAQGAPLYHLPVYQPLVYGHYPYPPYYQEYPMPVEGEPEKGPEEYPPEVVMEQEAVEAYYANAHYAPPYGPPVDAAVEYMPPVYLPPPPHHHQHLPQPQPPPHQFNVHAKNFVLGQGKAYVPPDKQPTAPLEAAPVSAASVEALPMKDLKLAPKGPGSPKHNERPVEVNQGKAVPSPTDKTKTIDPAKPAWVPENKVDPNFVHQQLSAKPFVPPMTTAQIAANKLPPAAGKPTKGPAAPFSSSKIPPKPSVPPTIVPVQQTATTPKAPFGNRQKREGPANRSPSSEQTESGERPAEHKREPSLPASKAPMPISITLPAAGQPLIVANKPPFGHSRKAQVPEPPPAPQPPPPAPTASDFPPPPTPRNRGELPPPVLAPQPQPAPGKSWASLFSSKASSIAPPLPTPAVHSVVEEPPSPTTAAPPVANIQKPVAKVQPYDASPLQQSTEKLPTLRAPMPVVPPVTVAPVISYSEKAVSYSEKALSYSEKALSYSEKALSSYSEKAISYSEKTSANVSPAASSPVAHAKPPVVQPEIREATVQKETTPATPVQPSPYCDDPNSYRMGEFLSKYQLDNRAVSVLPRGLTNRSNYCYVNAILQALIACPPFYNMLKALPYQTRRGKSSTPVIDSMVELCYEFSPLPTPPRSARGAGAPAPQVPAGPPLEGGAGLRVLRALRPFPGSQEGRQEDAEEFLGCLLNSLNDEMLELMKLVEPEEPKENATAQTNGVIAQEPLNDEEDDDEWKTDAKVMGPKNRGAVERRWAARRTPVSDIFRGKTRVRLHRATHHDVTDAVQPFFTLQLDIERASNVKDALELLAGKDTLEGVNDAWQQLSLEQLPVVLLLHLKCFQLDTEGHTAKIVKPIDFPMDLKIDPKIMSSKQKYTSKQRMYKLFAVVYHEGVEAVKGHYVTDTYHGQSGWIRYDDATVTQVNDGMVLKAKPPRMPYLLMYRRQDTLPAHRAKPE